MNVWRAMEENRGDGDAAEWSTRKKWRLHHIIRTTVNDEKADEKPNKHLNFSKVFFSPSHSRPFLLLLFVFVFLIYFSGSFAGSIPALVHSCASFPKKYILFFHVLYLSLYLLQVAMLSLVMPPCFYDVRLVECSHTHHCPGAHTF